MVVVRTVVIDVGDPHPADDGALEAHRQAEENEDDVAQSTPGGPRVEQEDGGRGQEHPFGAETGPEPGGRVPAAGDGRAEEGPRHEGQQGGQPAVEDGALRVPVGPSGRREAEQQHVAGHVGREHPAEPEERRRIDHAGGGRQ
jgi:hypothetical protein